MSALTMNPAFQAPHRKPISSYANPQAPQSQYTRVHDPAHARTRTNSSNVMPASHGPIVLPDRTSTMSTMMNQQIPPQGFVQQPPPQTYVQQPQPQSYTQHPQSQGYTQQPYPQPARRTLSNATSSTSSTSTNAGMQRLSGLSAPRRSTSSRSTSSASPTSYVALMRKQKATVWCDRAQHEDPRILAAQRTAKMRAAMEVAGGQNHTLLGAARTSTSSQGMVGGVRSKIRHHGAPKASTYTSGNLGGAGVPMRLSATEVDEGDSDDDAASQYARRNHTRNGSGRSSLGSGHRNHSSGQVASITRGYSNGSTPPGQSPVESMGDLVEEATPMPSSGNQAPDYFAAPGGQGGSGGSIQREENFGAIGGLPPPTRTRVEQDRKTSEELRRRGSVDDRTMTMGGGRLFVANPDLSD